MYTFVFKDVSLPYNRLLQYSITTNLFIWVYLIFVTRGEGGGYSISGSITKHQSIFIYVGFPRTVDVVYESGIY